MINKIKENFDKHNYCKVVGTKTNIHKVSYFFKENLELYKKRILIIDLEFSMNKHIFELGGLILNNGKVEELLFKEYSLPRGEPYYSFERNGFIDIPLNKGKPLFKDKEWLFSIIESVDYIVVHNYSAEAQCYFKLLHPYEQYDINRLPCFIEDKIICTNYSFKNKYFKELGLEKFSNSELSGSLGWSILDRKDKYVILNKEIEISFEIKKPDNVVSEIHNSFYDVLITLTNLISAKKIAE
jgi:hypothetical protein